MPQSINYAPIIDLISSPRINSYKITFKPSSNAELYGIYIWAQHAAASLYTLTQNIEVTLRNAIDKEARAKFGDFWWKVIKFSGRSQAQPFFDNINSAEQKLTRDWQNKERKRLRLAYGLPIPTATPVWSHDQIIASTDFSTWQFILVNAFNDKTKSKPGYLWPSLLGKAFKSYNIYSSDADTARHSIIAAVKEIRDLRNRVSHHEPIWTKSPAVIDAASAIGTIINKIDKIETLIDVIDRRKLDAMKKVGLMMSARRTCSLDEFHIYSYSIKEATMTNKKKRMLRSLTSKVDANNITAVWTYASSTYGLYRIR